VAPSVPYQRGNVGKYKYGNYIQVSKKGLEKAKSTGGSGGWLYIILVYDEHRFTGRKENFFYRSLEDLAADSGLSRSTIARLIPKLVAAQAIETWQGHFRNPKTGKLSEERMNHFRILD